MTDNIVPDPLRRNIQNPAVRHEDILNRIAWQPKSLIGACRTCAGMAEFAFVTSKSGKGGFPWICNQVTKA